MEPRKSAVLYIVSNSIAIALLATVCLAVHLAVRPFQRIFYCDDESISYPLHQGTIPFSACIGAAVPLGIIIVLGTEAARDACASERLKSGDNSRPVLLSVAGRVVTEKFAPLALATVAGLFQLVLAGLVNEAFTVVGKMGFGRQRPHFLAACQLNTTCSPGRPYTPDFCRPGSASDFKNAQMSFPSGHSSFCMVICVYLALYMQARLAFRHPMHSVKNAIQAALVLMGASVAMSRVSDYKHHWSDILAGGLLGTACAALAVSKFFAACRGYSGGGNSGGERYLPTYATESSSTVAAAAATSPSGRSGDAARIA